MGIGCRPIKFISDVDIFAVRNWPRVSSRVYGVKPSKISLSARLPGGKLTKTIIPGISIVVIYYVAKSRYLDFDIIGGHACAVMDVFIYNATSFGRSGQKRAQHDNGNTQ
jgi:hypothetical protein